MAGRNWRGLARCMREAGGGGGDGWRKGMRRRRRKKRKKGDKEGSERDCTRV